MMSILTATAVKAGPCTAQIDNLQAEIDAQIDRAAGIGPMGRESVAADDHHQPTPDSIARAEASLGNGRSYERALEVLSQARAADQAGDAASCARAVGIVRETIGN
ncbi:hypothetical protein J4G37_31990 [Microvirga sp. 3-52]|nr:hypothetical protein [Microvirga sp. 3-52]